ncbi:MAG: Tat pathway signal protein [Parvibaculaceae bacterium]
MSQKRVDPVCGRRRFTTAGALLGVMMGLSGLSAAASAKDDIAIELNRLEPVKDACQAYFLIEEKAGQALQSLKADLIIFGKDGGIAKRLIAEMGPVRSKKTSVKIFAIEVPCPEISGVLLNDVASCVPEATAEACLDRLAVSSRLPTRFYK